MRRRQRSGPISRLRLALLRARKRRIGRWVFGGVCVIVAFVIVLFLAEQRRQPRLDANDIAQVESGRHIYAKACASCHGVSLEGQLNWRRQLPDDRWPAPPLDASGQAWRHPDQVLFAITKNGPGAYPRGYRTDMPAFGHSLTDKEIAAILAFVKSTWPADMQLRQARRSLKSANAPHH